MRININRPNQSGGVLAPIEPLPPPDINDQFVLTLTASTTTFRPFGEVEMTWEITPRERAKFDDYVFELVDTYGVLATDLDAAAGIEFAPYRNTLVRVRGRRRSGGASSTLGKAVALAVDESDCETLELTASLVDAMVTERLTTLTSETASLRLRKRLIVADPVQIEEMEVESTWKPGSITYRFPLEVVVNNFFNADLDVELVVRPTVHHDGQDTDLEIDIAHTSDVDFDTVEDILSLGHSATAAKTADKLLPLVLELGAKEAERQLVRQVMEFIRSRLATQRLLAVRVVPLGNLSHLSIVLCPST